MLRTASILLLIGFAAACDAEPTSGTLDMHQTMADDAIPHVFLEVDEKTETATMRWLEPAEVRALTDEQFGVDAPVPDLRKPETLSEPVRRFQKIMSEGGPVYAVVDGPLGENVLAQVIRDPSAPDPQLIVLSEASVDDEVIRFAGLAWLDDAMNQPEIAERRVLSLMGDQRIKLETPAGVSWRDFAPKTANRAEDQSSQTRQLLARAAKAPKVEVNGVGQVRIVR